MRAYTLPLVITAAVTLCSCHPTPEQPTNPSDAVLNTPNLIAFWDFSEAAGELRHSKGGPQAHNLAEVNGPIERASVGPYSGYSAKLDGTQYLQIPYTETGDLNICGPDAEVSMFAVVRIENIEQSRTIAGMWSEGKGRHDDSGTRQYALLMHMPTYGGNRQLTPHISSEGGVTQRADGTKFPWCADYAATSETIPTDEWCTLSFTYDGEYITAYINGEYEHRELNPKEDRRDDPYFITEGPNGSDRGMNPYYHGRGIFCYEPEKHSETKPSGGSDFTVGARYAVGSMLREATIGHFGGLAVFDRALSSEEIKQLHESARIDELNAQMAKE
jgi:hypothetical protein